MTHLKSAGKETTAAILSIAVHEKIAVVESLEAYVGTILGLYATKNGPVQVVYHFASSEDLDARLSRAYAAVFDIALERWRVRHEGKTNICYKM